MFKNINRKSVVVRSRDLYNRYYNKFIVLFIQNLDFLLNRLFDDDDK